MALRLITRFAALALAAMTLAACNDASIPKDLKPLPAKLVASMDRMGMKKTSPVMIRLFKEESKLEVWKQRSDGQYALLKTYDICKWSGKLGPKIKEGDRQAPEGFYIVTPAQMNPKSSYYLSFNIGYPNAYDRSLGRTGSNLMVHGACSSSGCYSMKDEDAGELFWLARDAFIGGQREFLIMAFPFRMTPENFARHKDDPNIPFWKMLKVGNDHFEVTHQVPKVDVCNRSYVFDADAGNARFDASAACPAYAVPPAIASAVAAKEAADDAKYAVAVGDLQVKAEKAAEAKQKADEKAAVEAQAEAERAAHPSLIRRLLGAKPVPMSSQPEAVATGDAPPLPRPSPAAGAPDKAPTAAATAETAPVSATPLPRPKPKLSAKKASEVVAAVEEGKKKAAEAPAAKGQPAMKLLPTIDAESATQKPGAKKKAPPAAAAEQPLPDVMPTPAPSAAAAAPPPAPVPMEAAPAAPSVTATAAATDANGKPVGTFVKKKFLWPDDDGGADGAAAGQ
jgi:murein L,D-transpeptidase YafK